MLESHYRALPSLDTIAFSYTDEEKEVIWAEIEKHLTARYRAEKVQIFDTLNTLIKELCVYTHEMNERKKTPRSKANKHFKQLQKLTSELSALLEEMAFEKTERQILYALDATFDKHSLDQHQRKIQSGLELQRYIKVGNRYEYIFEHQKQTVQTNASKILNEIKTRCDLLLYFVRGKMLPVEIGRPKNPGQFRYMWSLAQYYMEWTDRPVGSNGNFEALCKACISPAKKRKILNWEPGSYKGYVVSLKKVIKRTNQGGYKSVQIE